MSALTEPLHDAPSAVRAFRRRFGRDPAVVVRAPGRVALLGAHVDYNDGWVMPAAIDRAVWLAATPAANGPGGRLVALDLDAEAELDPSALPPPRSERDVPDAGAAVVDAADGEDLAWLDLPAGVARVLGESDQLPALDAVFGGDLPRGAGVSSSAAVEVAFLLAWRELAGIGPESRMELARLGRRVENEYLGVGSGVMDQFASLHGRAGHVLFLDCRHLAFERLAVPESSRVVVFDSGVRRRLSASGFDDRRAECVRALAILRRHLPHLEALRDLDEESLELHAHRLDPALRRRVRHVVRECRRVRTGAEALRRGDLEAFGAAMRRSHASSRDLYEVSIPELDALCAASWSDPGCLGARLMGGGFGGCVAALVETEDDVPRLVETVEAAFEEEYGRRPASFVSRLADGATVWVDDEIPGDELAGSASP